MTTAAARTQLARSLRRHAGRVASAQDRNTHYATVQQVSPLQVELHGSRLLLTEDDLVVTQWVRRYGYDYGLKVGDTVVVSHMPNDDFVVHDVVSTGKVEDGFDLGTIVHSADPVWSGVAPGGGGAMTVTPDFHIVKKVTVRDSDGVIVGYVPIYGSLPA